MTELVQADADVRISLVPDPDVARQQADRHREHRRDLELARLERERRPRPAAAPLDRAHGGARLRQQHPPGGRERDAARQPLEQPPVELLLERADVLRERRLRDADRARGARERSLVDDGDEARQLPEVHSLSLSLRWPTAPLDLYRDVEKTPTRCAPRGSTTSASRPLTWRNRPGSTRMSSRWSGSRRRRSSRRCSGCGSATCSSISSWTTARRRRGTTSGSRSTTSTPPTRP